MAKKTDESQEYTIEQLFGSKTRVRLLQAFLENPERAYYVRELTRRIDAQLNSVRRELKNLVGLGIVEEVEGSILPEEQKDGDEESKKSHDKKKYYRADQRCSIHHELRGIMQKSAVMSNDQFVADLSLGGALHVLILTGQFVDSGDLPADMLIVGEIKQTALRSAIAAFEQHIGREINYTYMPLDEFNYRLEIADRFLTSLLVPEKIVLVNETDREL